MSDLKKLLAIILVSLTVVFGILITIGERYLFNIVFHFDFSSGFVTSFIDYLLSLLINISLIIYPIVDLALVLIGKREPYKAIIDCAIVIVGKYLLVVLLFLISMISGSTWEQWKETLFSPGMLIIPLVVFFAGFLFTSISGSKKLDGTFARAVLITIGAGLTIFGLIFYYARGGALSTLGIFGLVVAILCLAGAVVYSFLPQTKDY